MKTKAYASFDHYLAGQAPRNQDVIRVLRKFVKRVAPQLQESVKWGNGCWVQRGRSRSPTSTRRPTHVRVRVLRRRRHPERNPRGASSRAKASSCGTSRCASAPRSTRRRLAPSCARRRTRTAFVDDAGSLFGSDSTSSTATGQGVGVALTCRPDVDLVSFTGSTRAGIEVAKNAAATVKRVHQELGGKNPNIILDDDDLPRHVARGVRDVMTNSGQSCDAPTRMLVPTSRMAETLAIAKQTAELVRRWRSDRRRHTGPGGLPRPSGARSTG